MRTAHKSIMLFAILFAFSLSTSAGDMDNFAKCISKSGAKYYRTWWCPYCADQNKLFGSAERFLPTVECSKQGSREKLARCEDIPGFPTWVFKDGGQTSGTLSLSLLAEFTHCPLPGSR
jgi:hypothetical protein